MLEIKNISKTYESAEGQIKAVDRLSLTVQDGEFAAIMGRSGAGKTTLFSLIAGLEMPDAGEILLDGVDLCRQSERQMALLRRRKIGVIYQFYNLVPELTVSENITLPAFLDGKETDDGRLEELLSLVGMAARADAYPDTLSGGQQQRVAVARALFQRPTLLLADEPTGNLDAENSAEVLGLLRQVNREQGVTVLMVTHSREAAESADRIICIEHGKVAEESGGDHEPYP